MNMDKILNKFRKDFFKICNENGQWRVYKFIRRNGIQGS